jgi:hypothetical protein
VHTYAQQSVFVNSQTTASKLDPSFFYSGSPIPVVVKVEITVDFEKILFTVDGSDPYTRHCQYGLQFVEWAQAGDVIELTALEEIAGFRAVKFDGDNSRLSVLYYRD